MRRMILFFKFNFFFNTPSKKLENSSAFPLLQETVPLRPSFAIIIVPLKFFCFKNLKKNKF